MIKYQVVRAQDPQELEEKVNKKLEEGWDFVPGFSVDANKDHSVAYARYFQAMVIKE